MVVSHLSTDIVSINIVYVFLHSICLFEIIDLVKSPVQFIMVIMVLSNGIFDFFPSIKPMLVGFPPFQRISFSI